MELLKPQQFDIEISSKCNLECKLCPSLLGSRSSFMSLETFIRITDRIKEESPESSVVPWLNGEPFMNPDYDKMLLHLNKLKLKYDVTTNASIYREDVFYALLAPDSSCYQIIFSLDGLPNAKSKSIEIARPGSKRYSILCNIYHFLRRAKLEKPDMDVAVKICERGQDWQEIEEYIQHFLEEGFSYVCLGKPLSGENEESMRMYPCQYSDHKFMVIKSDGLLVPCAYNVEATEGKKINFGFYDGSESLIEKYNSPAYQEFRTNQRNGIFHPVCQKCSFAYTGSGFKGQIQFREGILKGKTIYHKRDYYNSFFSLVEKNKEDAYYSQPERKF